MHSSQASAALSIFVLSIFVFFELSLTRRAKQGHNGIMREIDLKVALPSTRYRDCPDRRTDV